ncbi:MAG: homocysteine S-methyltransferase family protein [Cyclobacteriaceae bacterium]
MSLYRSALPQLSDATFMTDGGLETDLIFNRNIDLPEFAVFDLLKDDEGKKVLREYFSDYLTLSKTNCRGFILETPTYRASPDWAQKIGYSAEALKQMCITAVQECELLRKDYGGDGFSMPISMCIGPRGDGYAPGSLMSIREAEAYHAYQVEIAAATNADLVSAFTMNYNEEATGIVRAARHHHIPVVISYTVDTDGRLPSGQPLGEAITTLDMMTDRYVSYYMINCAHPDHFKNVLQPDAQWTARIRGIRANASDKSHAQLDESETLDAGDKHQLAGKYCELKAMLPNLNIIGGCCGTDHTHLNEICNMWFG